MSPAAELLEVWNAAAETPEYRLDERALESRPIPEADLVLERGGKRLLGFAAVAGPGRPWSEDRSGHLRLIAVRPEAQGRGLGRRLLERAEALLRERGAGRVVAGEEPHHFLPGPPSGWTGIARLLETAGYEASGRVSNDLARDLRGELPPLELPAGARVAPAEPERVLDFVKAAFPGRWQHDVGLLLERDPSLVLALEVDGDVRGFAAAGLRTDPALIPSALFPTEDCGLGPMGVARDLRGRGLGRAILVAAMQRNRERGGTRMGIDWTGVEGFYRRAGFEVVRQYRHWARTPA